MPRRPSKVTTSSNGSNARKALTNKVATADKCNVRRVDANVATTANVMTSDIRAGANVAVNANANKTASNIKKRVPMYQAT